MKIKKFIYREILKYIKQLRYRRIEGFSDKSLESSWLIAKINELWYWKNRYRNAEVAEW